MGVFQRIGNAMVRFMYGRNGMDQLNRALIFLYLGLCVLRTILLLALESIVPGADCRRAAVGSTGGAFFPHVFQEPAPAPGGEPEMGELVVESQEQQWSAGPPCG